VPRVRFRKRQSLSDGSCAELSQGPIPPLQMIRLSAAFANTIMRLFRKDQLIGFPDDKCYDLVRAATHHFHLTTTRKLISTACYLAGNLPNFCCLLLNAQILSIRRVCTRSLCSFYKDELDNLFANRICAVKTLLVHPIGTNRRTFCSHSVRLDKVAVFSS